MSQVLLNRDVAEIDISQGEEQLANSRWWRSISFDEIRKRPIRLDDGETLVNRRFAFLVLSLSLQFFSFNEASEDGLRDLARANSFISDNRAPGKNLWPLRTSRFQVYPRRPANQPPSFALKTCLKFPPSSRIFSFSFLPSRSPTENLWQSKDIAEKNWNSFLFSFLLLLFLT